MRRLTHMYVGGWAGLDDWKSIGMWTLASRAVCVDANDDGLNPHWRIVHVTSEASDALIQEALRSTFSTANASTSTTAAVA